MQLETTSTTAAFMLVVTDDRERVEMPQAIARLFAEVEAFDQDRG